jgi:pimeloyl-ACP methyl ester carboxylesterase
VVDFVAVRHVQADEVAEVMMGKAHPGPRLLATSGGGLEVVIRDELLIPNKPDRPGAPTLYFHGGHESATTAPASDLYLELGYPVVLVSRPGYGHTDVGPLSPAAFAPLVDEARAMLGIDTFTAVIGTSFGGPQAVEYAGRYSARTRALILHSAGPSTLPYPDSAVQRLLGPVMFHPSFEQHVWRAVGFLLRHAPRLGLRLMMSTLSTEPVSTWLPLLDEADHQAMREVLARLRSGHGFVTDLSYASTNHRQIRRTAQQRVTCPTLVTASRHDRGVAWAHAEDLAATIPRARLEELPSPSHLFWLGPARAHLLTTIRDFLATLPD